MSGVRVRRTTGKSDSSIDMMPGQFLFTLCKKDAHFTTPPILTFLAPNSEEASQWLENLRKADAVVVEENISPETSSSTPLNKLASFEVSLGFEISSNFRIKNVKNIKCHETWTF